MSLISTIPEAYKKGFKKIASLDDEEFSSILSGLSYTSLVSSIKLLATKISEMQSLDTKDLKDVFSSIGSLVPMLETEEMIEDIAEDIAELILNDKIIELSEKEKFKKRVFVLLQNKPIYYAAKSQALLNQNANTYIGSKIITDLRPVFDIDLDVSPKGGMIIHNLHIHYRADQEADHKDLFVSLDAKDIKSLKEALIRAENKEVKLQSIFEKTGMTNLND